MMKNQTENLQLENKITESKKKKKKALEGVSRKLRQEEEQIS